MKMDRPNSWGPADVLFQVFLVLLGFVAVIASAAGGYAPPRWCWWFGRRG